MNTLQVRQTIYRTLEQQKLHAPLALAGSLYGSLKHRHPVRVQHEDGLWIHRHPDGVVVYRQIYTVTPSQLAEITADIFFHTYTPGPGDVVVDVGAGVGTEVLSLSERVGARGRVVAIEASPSAFGCLESCVRLNALGNVEPEFCAAFETNGSVVITDDGDSIGNHINSGVGVEVPARRLDDLLREKGIEKVDFLKMNIEGAETGALAGMPELLRATEHVAISCHDFIADRTGDDAFRTRTQIIATLRDAGFHVSTRHDRREFVAYTVYGDRRA